ncbi:Uncharacterised protein [Staphylococcus aureus]|nr:Uncharacterised protein [Staphylococcus aureus]CXM08575.1 Uncharacterised protein [Staphylococcus aureus]
MKMIIAIVQDQDSQDNLLKITLEQQNWQQQVGF